MFNRTIKTALLAAAVVVATAGASFAATYGWVDQYSKVKHFHNSGSPTVNQVHVGQKVKIVSSWGNWYKIQIPGNDGWVKKHVVDLTPFPGPGPFPGYGGYGGSFCVNGSNAQFCISGGY